MLKGGGDSVHQRCIPRHLGRYTMRDGRSVLRNARIRPLPVAPDIAAATLQASIEAFEAGLSVGKDEHYQSAPELKERESLKIWSKNVAAKGNDSANRRTRLNRSYTAVGGIKTGRSHSCHPTRLASLRSIQ